MDPEEEQHFLEVVEGFVFYKDAMLQTIQRKEKGWRETYKAGRIPEDLNEKMEKNFVQLRQAG